MPERWIIDTDMGYDDWLAILFMLQHPRVEVTAISVSGAGTGRCPTMARGALDLIALAGIDPASVSVAAGPDAPLEGFHSFPTEWRDLGDEWLGVVPTPSGMEPDPRGAVAMLIEILRAAAAPLSILALGPMTNLALVFEQAPELRHQVREIVYMGGAVDVPGNVRVEGFTGDAPNDVSEWNIFVDPVAARIVFASGVPIRLVPLDATNHAPITPEFVRSFVAHAVSTPAVAWVSTLLRRLLDPNDTEDIGEHYFWDTLAAAVAVDRDICSYRYVSLTVLADTTNEGWHYPGTEQTFPDTSWQGRPRQALVTATAGQTVRTSPATGNWVLVCQQPDKVALEAAFMCYLGGIDRLFRP